ncbi:dTDP-4-dehydrorhamnose 3,5-epimerase [Echinicola strongylocentroti]|uniref:dTDP-4-dehydrorhamnose 3,5-epimerase n=1 Tax=Echinicola strongylocentroti TaxID=1795355 RepID=A0A2Z4IKF5_9BACT|nr:dTDP-4-dehydrorhamnose 3,5-epimerase [Echinicola strongylocentroti]AWW30853.1 dTDP-4-dehydrorhamnose 3,5-epimerase [Echinicola strongylocentroti]
MEIRSTPIQDVFELYPKVFNDARGYFLETYREDLLAEKGINTRWVQDNQSFSIAGTVRGLHFQHAPHAQAKLVRVVTGKVYDVCVDLRKDSPTFGQSHGVILDSAQHNMLYVPEGFAHGFSVLEDAVFSYKCSNFYNKASEGGIIWDDKQLDIDWKVGSPILSDKDLALPSLEEFKQQTGGGL